MRSAHAVSDFRLTPDMRHIAHARCKHRSVTSHDAVERAHTQFDMTTAAVRFSVFHRECISKKLYVYLSVWESFSLAWS